jgi:hypothetical protein
MALNLAGLMAPLAAPPRPEEEFERALYMPRQQELAQQLGQAKLGALQQQTEQSAAMAPLQQQMEQQKLAQAQTMGPLQQQLIQQQVEQARAMDPLQQQLIQQQTALARTKSLFTPDQALNQALEMQRLKNSALFKTAQLKNIADSPFEKARAARLDKVLGTVNNNANEAMEAEMPLYHKLLGAIQAVPLGTGPLRQHIMWSTPQGQYLQALLNQNQGAYIKQFHLGRMTQYEFNLLRQARGGSATFRPALLKLVKDQIEKAKLDIAKQHMYNTYVAGGGRNPDEIAGHWSKQNPNLAKQIEVEVGESIEGPKQPISPAAAPVTGPIMPKDQWIAAIKRNPKAAQYTDAQLSAYYDANYGGRK